MTFPSTIFEQRDLENLSGLDYDRLNKKTLFAEDIEDHGYEIRAIETTLGAGVTGTFDTVSDRLDSMSGGGGGAGLWEFVSVIVPTGTQSEIYFDSLDIATDGQYLVTWSLDVTTQPLYVDFYGASGLISTSGNVEYSTGSAVDATSWQVYMAHPSIGPGFGSMVLTTIPNGSLAVNGQVTIANSRSFRFGIIDTNWYSGGQNLEKVRMYVNGGGVIKSGGEFRLYKRAS